MKRFAQYFTKDTLFSEVVVSISPPELFSTKRFNVTT